uniref:Uncharacterized protein n=1 Tax=Equus caballus TaxID=9796 RepID=A0A9L0RD20_HORSE
MTIIEKIITSVDESVEKREPFVHCWWECKPMQPLWKTVWRFLKELKELPYDPAIPHLHIYPKKTKTLIQKYVCMATFTAALFTIAKIWKQCVHRWRNG